MIFLVKRTDKIGYDEHDAIVVRAKTAGEAEDMGAELWGEGHKVKTERILATGKSKMVLKSFRAG